MRGSSLLTYSEEGDGYVVEKAGHKIIYGTNQFAGEGRRIDFPYDPPTVSKPIDLWKKGK